MLRIVNHINHTAGGAIRINNVGINFWGRGLWKIILFIITVNITAHIIRPTEKKNHDNSINSNGTHATGANIFHTIGKNHNGFIDFISCGCSIHLLNIIIVNIDWIDTHITQKYLEMSIFIDRNHIANIKNIFHIPGKKLDFTEWLKSAFTSEKLIIALIKYAIIIIIKYTNVKYKK